MDKLLCVVLITTALVQIMSTNSHVVWSSNAVDGVSYTVNMNLYLTVWERKNVLMEYFPCLFAYKCGDRYEFPLNRDCCRAIKTYSGASFYFH